MRAQASASLRHRAIAAVRTALFGGVAALALGSGVANAQGMKSILGTAGGVKAPVADDGLGPRDVYVQADVLIDDRDRKTVTAEGSVEARYQGRTLRAKRVIYDTVTGAARATGDVVVINADGTSEYAQDMQLDDQFRTAVALGFAARLEQNVTIAAGAAVRRTDEVSELRQAVYTPCPICKADGVTPVTPTWSVQATRIIQDRRHHVIYYRNAILRVKGVPVMFFPVFWHPDPSTPRRSGLLAPRIQYSRRRGFSYEQGYLQTLGPSADLVISPQINSRVNPLLNLAYTERFYSGDLEIRGGYTHEKIFDNHTFYGDNTNRSYLLARGRFDLSDTWDWGFGAERVTDPTFFRRYGVERVYINRGEFPADTDRLISQLFTTREDSQSYLSIAALDFQSIRQNGTEVVDENGAPTTRATFESSKAFPVVGPLIEARWAPDLDVFGGRITGLGSAVVLTRSNPVYSATDPLNVVSNGAQRLSLTGFSSTAAALLGQTPANGQALGYTDERRVSGVLSWTRDLTLAGGVRVTPYAEVRGDYYSIGDPLLATAATPGMPATATMAAIAATPGSVVAGDSNVTRALGTLGATVSWPLIRQIGTSSLILEPIAQLAVSPHEGVRSALPNEDSVAFEFDETNLFSFNRFPGFDEYEGGARANVGGRANWLWGAGHNATFTVGRVFRTQPDEVFSEQTGLRDDASDWVVALQTSPITGLTAFTRARLDRDDFHVHREEAGVNIGYPRLNGGVSYDYNENGLFVDPTTGLVRTGKTQDANVNLTAFPLRHWGFSALIDRDLQQQITPISQFALIYRDDCIRVDVVYTHDETYAAAIGSSNSVTVRLTLATLGDTSNIGQGRVKESR
ncbi:MAG: LPS-assembly protein LptD [Caulobacteraceae bacterium]|nr:LPS-assembly protein LptD [Caulobacter sp.]